MNAKTMILIATVAPAFGLALGAFAKTEAAKPRIEVCFVLDTTGSMTGLIEGAKQKIWSIANEMIGAKPTPEIKIGLIGYRDRGDEYVTKVFDLTDDIDAMYAHLKAFQANGGGDEPESVNQALYEAVHKITWSQDHKVLKIIFLVGDAPPHMDYKDGPDYHQVCLEAVKRDLLINTVQCGSIAATGPIWREIARLSEGTYVAIAQAGNMTAIATPVDAEIAALNREMGKTVVAYGTAPQRAEVAGKVSLAAASPAPVVADRLSYNARSGKTVQGAGELVDSVAAGTVKLEEVKREQLPPELQKMSAAELKTYVEKQQAARAELQKKINGLNQKRDSYIEAEKKRLAASGKGDSFDEKVAETIRSQAATKGIEYGK